MPRNYNRVELFFRLCSDPQRFVQVGPTNEDPLDHTRSWGGVIEHVVILCFDRRSSKQNSVIRLKSRFLDLQNFWAAYATGLDRDTRNFFSSYLSIESRSMLPNPSLVMEFPGNIFTNFNFEKLLSHETLVTGGVTATNNNQTRLFKWLWMKKMFERYRQFRLFPKQILCQSYFIFSKWMWFANAFKCFSDRNVWPPG